MIKISKYIIILLSKRGTDITTPIPVPIHSLLDAINIAVILIHDSCGLSEPEMKKINFSC